MLNSIISWADQSFINEAVFVFVGAFIVVCALFIIIVMVGAILDSIFRTNISESLAGPMLFVMLLGILFLAQLLHYFGIVELEQRTSKFKQSDSGVLLDTSTLDKLVGSLANVSELTVAELQEVVRNVPLELNRISVDIQSQNVEMKDLRFSLIEQRAEAQRAKDIAENLKPISKSEIEAIKFVISEDSSEAAFRFFILGISASIPVGFFVSFLSHRFTIRRTTAPDAKSDNNSSTEGA